LTNQQTVNPFSSVTQGRIKLPLPAPPPSLWRYIGPTNHNCQRRFSKKEEFSFHRPYGPF
ncbi:hypothetical protein, partial [Brucella ceti]|uniref:hypothetical protein n=1 Tax=Brucella ceti TaxID=120577 RepID=UPI0035D40A41